VTRSFEELLAEGAAVPVEGWDFSWRDGRFVAHSQRYLIEARRERACAR
jgi:hypothetical protein